MSLRHVVRPAAFPFVLVTALCALCGHPASAQPAWRDGLITYTYDFNCLSGLMEPEAGTLVGQLYDTNYAEPYVGQRFYMRVAIYALGHPCSTMFYVDAQFVPPAPVTVSALPEYPVRCFYAAPPNGAFTEFFAVEGCPQPPFQVAPNSAGTGYRIDRRAPGETLPWWPLPFAGAYEFWIPVVSDRPLDGLGAATKFTAPIQIIDGLNNFWTYPWQTTYVAGAPDVVFRGDFE